MIAVTGATGFLGIHFLQALQERRIPAILERPACLIRTFIFNQNATAVTAAELRHITKRRSAYLQSVKVNAALSVFCCNFRVHTRTLLYLPKPYIKVSIFITFE